MYVLLRLHKVVYFEGEGIFGYWLTGDLTIVHCSMLAEDAIKSAISNYYTKNPKAASTDLGGTAAAMPKIEVEKVAQQSATA